ncbi:MAG TPA: type II toxin-antitoxin system VapC family toxin [Candidatus Acidoferrum sp.]|nr:type II toxin-antitoxin system VapC family toxin [Candidatus Acidoferrum sp.]
MMYLLDTSIFLWSLGAEHKLNQKARDLLSSSAAELYLSSASSWEISIKFALGSLALPKPPSQFVPNAIGLLALRSLDITHFHSLAAGELPPHHRDPFDRMLIAQARMENMLLLTADRTFLRYEVKIMFCGK